MEKNFFIFMAIIVGLISFGVAFKYLHLNSILFGVRYSNFLFIKTQEVKSISATKSVPFPILSINFDDGFSSAIEIALPILSKHNIKATFFIITNAINQNTYLTSNQLQELQADGQEIGAHTRHHPHLSTLSQQEQLDEIVGSKSDLEQMGIKNVVSFAYPFGDYSSDTEDIVKKYFYDARTTKAPGFNNINIDPHTLKSETVIYNTKLDQIKNLIDEAIKQNSWLILVFHRIDEQGNRISADGSLLDEVLTYAQTKNISILPNSEVLPLIIKDYNK